MIGSLISGLIGQGGANAAAGEARNAAAGANSQAFAQGNANSANASPYMALGTRGASVLGGLLGYGNLQASGGTGGYDFQTDPTAYDRTKGYLEQFRQATNAPAPTFTPMSAISGTFQADPSYAWRYQQGLDALDRSAASRGMLLSGAQVRGAQDYGQNAASQEYGNWFQRLMAQNAYNQAGNQWQYGANEGQYNNALNALFQMTGQGNQAQSSLAGTNSGLIANANNALMQGANIAGNATMEGANDLAGGISSGINNALLGSYLFRNNLFGGGGTSYKPGGTGGP